MSQTVTLHLGDCLDVLRGMEAGSVDAVVTDPPAGIGFMGKGWDHDRGGRERWIEWLAERLAEARRVARPGAFALVWALPRTSHWTALALETAGWIIRDRVSHLFGSGFPKSKSCLKPACEDWWLAKAPGPLVPLGIDGCRIGIGPDDDIYAKNPHTVGTIGAKGVYGQGKPTLYEPKSGRWPANVTHDGSEEVLEAFAAFGESEKPVAPPGRPARSRATGGTNRGVMAGTREPAPWYGDTGTAARFFYCAKASRSDRGEGNTHPTVKNTELMRWLCRLITPPGGTVLDPFMGSGSTGKACAAEGFGFVGIEVGPAYHAIASRRIAEAQAATPLFASQ